MAMGRQSLILFAMKVLVIISVPTRILAITTTPMDPKTWIQESRSMKPRSIRGLFQSNFGVTPPTPSTQKQKNSEEESETLLQSPLGSSWNPAPEKNNCEKNTHSSTEAWITFLFKLQSISQPFEFEELNLHCFFNTSDCPLGVSHALVGLWWSLLNQELISLDISYHA